MSRVRFAVNEVATYVPLLAVTAPGCQPRAVRVMSPEKVNTGLVLVAHEDFSRYGGYLFQVEWFMLSRGTDGHP